MNNDENFSISDMVLIPQGAVLLDIFSSDKAQAITNSKPFYAVILEKSIYGNRQIYVINYNENKLGIFKEDLFKC